MASFPKVVVSEKDANGGHSTYIYGVLDSYFEKLSQREKDAVRNAFLIRADLEPLIMGVPKSTWDAMGEAQRLILINDARFEGEYTAGMPTSVFDGFSPDQKIEALKISQERNEPSVAGVPSRIFNALSDQQKTQAWKTERSRIRLNTLERVFRIAAISATISLFGYLAFTAFSGNSPNQPTQTSAPR